MFTELLNAFEKELEAFEASEFLEFNEIGPELNPKPVTHAANVEFNAANLTSLEEDNLVNLQLI